MAVAVALVAAGVAGVAIGVFAMGQAKPDKAGQGITVEQLRAEASRQAALPKCSEVFRVGQVIDQKVASGGCLDPDGGVQSVGVFRCNDGRHLWQVDAHTGATAGFGFSGEKYVASKDAARDPAYGRANDACGS